MSKGGPVQLKQDNLRWLTGDLQLPAYDRRAARDSIVHIGVGGFFRAHQAVYMDDLLRSSDNAGWGYCGVGLLEHDARMRDALLPQDCLYTVVERSVDGDRARVIGALLHYLHAPQNLEAVLQKLASPKTRIVSLTITEGGYYVIKGSGEFNDSHPDIVRDLEQPHRPRCSFGVLVEALDRRRKQGIAPFTVMSCDNLQHNGDLTRSMLLAFAERRDVELATWMAEHCAFPNSMVDRITPATTDQHRLLVREAFGVVDAWPVVTEPFTQWVIEDDFPGGRPTWEAVGAQITSDVLPYEKVKMRLLNASHQAMCYIGMLLGYEFAHEAMGDPRIRRLVQMLMDVEVSPLLTPPPGIDLANYKRTLIERFSNPTVCDQLARIGTDGSARIPGFVLPSVSEALQRGSPVKLLSFTVAAWFRYLAGSDDAGRPLPINDALADRLQDHASRGERDAGALLGIREVFGEELPGCEAFADEVKRALVSFYEIGAEQTLNRYSESWA